MLKNCKPGVCNDPTELNYYQLKASGEPDGAGSFGFINLDGSSNNPGSSTLGDWIVHGFDGYLDIGDYNSRTGNAFSSTNIGDVLRSRIGTDLLFPVYRKLTHSGSNAKYEIIGWVVFHLTDLDLQGNNEKLYGYFKEMIWQGIQVHGGTPGNGQEFFGVRSVELVE
jgi:hypothetical protein